MRNIENLFGEKDKSDHYRPRIMCHLCHMKFSSCETEKFKKHKQFCTNGRAQVQNMPDKDYKLKFEESDHDKQYLNENMIFYDF